MIVERANGSGFLFGIPVDPLPLITSSAAAALLGLKRHTLACYRTSGGGPAYFRFGRAIRYAPADLQTWAADRGRAITPSPAPFIPCGASPAMLIDTNAAPVPDDDD